MGAAHARDQDRATQEALSEGGMKHREGVTLDAGALIALERDDREVFLLLHEVRRAEGEIVVPAGVVAQAWRGGRKQTRIAQLLAADEVEIEVLDDFRARAAGQLCGVTGTNDVVDASVVLAARSRSHPILTSDPDDLGRLDRNIELVPV
jgi:hypothetical protein